MKVAIASDHGGVETKARIFDWFSSRNIECVDLGPSTTDSVDYPDFAAALARGIQSGEFDSGVLLCRSGLGMSMAANRFRGVRAALCREALSAKMARLHNDANVLVLGADFTGWQMIESVLATWMETAYEGGRHQRRVELIDKVAE